MKDGESMLHHTHHNNNGHVSTTNNNNSVTSKQHEPTKSQPPEPHESLLDAAYRLRYDEAPHEGHRQRPLELPETSLDKLAHRVEGLMQQVQCLMRKSQERFEKVGENLVPPAKGEE